MLELVQPLLDLAKQRPTPKAVAPSSIPETPPGYVLCACKEKAIEMQEVVYTHTGAVLASDNACKECRALRPSHAKIVCAHCRAVVALLSPFKDPFRGFEFKADGFYHVLECPNCNPDVVASDVIEKKLYEKERQTA